MSRLPEVDAVWSALNTSINGIMETLDDLSAAEMNWRPADTANSLFVLATHTMGSTREGIIEILGGESVGRHREAEFEATGDSAAQLRQNWQELQEQLEKHLDQVSAEDLERMCHHPRRGSMRGREVLVNVIRHAAEHHGHAGLTRDLILARRPSIS